MQTAIALCYFCENHGPRIVITCQPMRNSELPPRTTSGLKKEAIVQSERDDGHQQNHQIEEKKENEGKSMEEGTHCFGNSGSASEVVDDEQRCAACSSFEHGMGMLSNDLETELSYVSTQAPISEKLNHLLKQACLRSLSVEISAPLLVETEQHNHTSESEPLPSTSTTSGGNHSHQIKGAILREDAERDGVVLFGDDEHWYCLSYTFRLKDAKARGFHRSYSMVVISLDKLLLLRNYDFFVNAMGEIIAKLQDLTNKFFALEQERDSELRLASKNVSISSKGGAQHWLPHQFYPKQYAVDTKRSLQVISDFEQIFTVLHRQMLTLLKTLNGLDKDIVLEGCPTQDHANMMELRYSRSMEEKELIKQLSPRQSLLHLANLRVIVSRLREEANHSSDLLMIILWHVVIGGQIVVRSDSLTARRLFLLALIQLLPVGCVKMASDSPLYSYSYKNNFLGCSPSVQIPEDALSDICLFTLDRNKEVDAQAKLQRKDAKPNITDLHYSLRRFYIRIDSFPERTQNEMPSIVGRYCQLLLDPILNDITLGSAIQSTRNDWLNNAKLIFQLRHQRNAIDLNRVLRIIKCHSNDSSVILFWQKGLSQHYKEEVRSTANNCVVQNADVFCIPIQIPRKGLQTNLITDLLTAHFKNS